MVTFLSDNNFGDDVGDGVAGPVGLLLIVLLIIGTVLLVRDMNKRLKRLPHGEFPRAAAPGGPVGGSVGAAPGATPDLLAADDSGDPKSAG